MQTPRVHLSSLPLLAAFALVLPGCDPTPRGEAEIEEVRSDIRQTAFRLRADIAAPLNADVGWAGPSGEGATLFVERPFRVRFEVERDEGSTEPLRLRLQVRRNGGAWTNVAAEDFPYPETATPRVSIVSPAGYPAGAATTDLLRGATSTFAPGVGVVLDTLTAPWPSGPDAGAEGSLHSEWEWPLVIRRFADGAVTNEDGDTFEFRMTDRAGRPLAAAAHPWVTVAVPEGLLAGTFVETPERLGPWQTTNGDLYFVMEPAESDNVLMVVRSSDGGRTWAEVDGPGRPATGDLEGFATAFRNGRIHMLHQTSEAVFHHAFGTSDDAHAPDAWVARDELVAEPAEPPTQVAALQARSDGSLVAVYGGPERIRMKVRDVERVWGAETVVDAGLPVRLSGPQTVLGRNDIVHLAYTAKPLSAAAAPESGTVWYRRIERDGSLGSPVRIAEGAGVAEEDIGAVAPLVHLAESNTVVVLYRLAEGELWERRILDGGEASQAVTPPVMISERSVVQNSVDSDQVGADAIADGERVHLLFIDEDSGGIYHTESDAPGSWSSARLVQGGIRTQWVRGARVTRPDGTVAYGFVYDAGSYGGSGFNRYGEITLGGR